MEPQQLNTDHFHCIICNKDVKDMYDHMDELWNTDVPRQLESKHHAYDRKVAESGYELPCFCNGAIRFWATGPDGGEARCIHCDLIWQEL